jgi:hypothetical protein
MCGPCTTNNVLATWFCCGDQWGRCCLYFDGTRCVPCPNGTCPPGKNCNDSRCRGACGNCQSSNYQCAWPNRNDQCLSVTQPQACGLTVPRLGCGAAITVQSRCTGRSVNTTIADCGPLVKNFCYQARNCPGMTFVIALHRVIDLTPAAFMAIGNLDDPPTPVLISQMLGC